jgi:outer membrane protein insertion porin family
MKQIILSSNRHNFLLFCLIIFFLFFLQAASLAAESAADGADILFFPLKINTTEMATGQIDKVDRALYQALRVYNIPLLSRAEAEKRLNYQTEWPLPIALIKTAVSNEYAALGTLNKFGKKISIDLVVYDMLAPAFPQYLFAQAESEADLNRALDELVRNTVKFTNKESIINEIIIKGNHKIDSGAILNHINNRSGDFYNPRQLRQSLKNVYKMGFFNDVRIEAEDTDSGKRVIFTVVEKDIINTLTITGEKLLKENEIKEVMGIVPHTIINAGKVQEAISNIKKLYKEKGYYDTEVSVNQTYPSQGKVNLRFDIQEGAKAYVKKIIIHGNHAFSDSEIKKIMITSTKGWLSWFTESGVLKRDMLNQDASRIGAFYSNNGYIDVKIGKPEVAKHGEWLYVTFNIEEGEPYKTGLIEITGELLESEDFLLKFCQVGEEKYFSRKMLREDILRITDFYSSKGFAYAEVVPAIHKNHEFKRVDLTLKIEKGVLVYVNRIIIKGNTRTRDKVIRREITLKEKDVFDSSAIKISNNRLNRLEFFEDVSITPEPTDDEDLMDVIVDLKEKPTGSFSIGAGYSSVDSVMVMGEISQNNFLGRGQSLSLQANLSSTNTRFNLGFTEPHLNDSKLAFGFDVYKWRNEYDDYTKDATGFAIRLSYPVWKYSRLYGSFGHDDSDLSDVSPYASQAIKDSQDIQITNFVSLGLSRDTRNRRYDTTAGSINSISVKYAGGPLGGDSSFTKYEGTSSWYFPWRWDTTFHVKMSAGYVQENSSGKLPVYEKFYLGGLSSMRGFESGDISPEVTTTYGGYTLTEKIGGIKMFYSNLEYIFPLFKEAGLKGVVFFDIGDVWDAGEKYGQDEVVDDASNVRKSTGFGFRWMSPMGPLRLEWGYNIDPEDDEDQSLWDFSIGGQF